MNPAKHSKIFITGATGFVGSYIVRLLLARGYNNIWALRRSESQNRMCYDFVDQVQWVEADICDLDTMMDAMESVEYVIHCAAMISFLKKDYKKMNTVNVEGTQCLLEAAVAQKVSLFIHISSIAALGSNPIGKVDESIYWTHESDTSQYSISKFYAEQEVWRAHAEGMRVAILNPAVVLGAGIWSENTASFFQRIDRGLQFFPPGKTGFVDVRDIAKATIGLMESDVNGERYVLCGENVSYRVLFEKIAKSLEKSIPKQPMRKWMGYCFSLFTRITSWMIPGQQYLTRQMIRTAMKQEEFSSEKIKTQINFEFTTLDKTVEETAICFRKSSEQDKIIFLSIDEF